MNIKYWFAQNETLLYQKSLNYVLKMSSSKKENYISALSTLFRKFDKKLEPWTTNSYLLVPFTTMAQVLIMLC